MDIATKLAMNTHNRIRSPHILSEAAALRAAVSAGSLARVQPDGSLAAIGDQTRGPRKPTRPRVDLLATGGTIASVAARQGAGVAPTLGVEELVRSAPALTAVADLRTAQFMQRPSTAITFAQLLALRDKIDRRVQDGSAGVVVTQGTDTIEETAFALDLLWSGDAPIVITGAMRNPSLPGADGPANLLAAVQVAATPQARGLGALVVFDDEIHAARFVAKTHTSSLSAFRSRPVGALGWLTEGRPVIAARPVSRMHLDVPPQCGDPAGGAGPCRAG
jgi:L-asparaginase